VIQRKWLILTALALEARAVAAELGAAAQDVSIQVIGIGASRLSRDLPEQISGIILAGLAGGLDPTLLVGETVFDGPPTADSSSAELLAFRGGKIYASDHLVSTVEEKQRLFRETGCLAVDMESGFVRTLAESAGLPLLHIRSISDTADEPLPPEMLDWIDDVGQPRLSKVAGSLALHPMQIPTLIRLARNTRLAAGRMAHAVCRIVQTRIAS
jgi:adenosylhomocysteine nucleosidase